MAGGEVSLLLLLPFKDREHNADQQWEQGRGGGGASDNSSHLKVYEGWK
jgi:hypothetical protein